MKFFAVALFLLPVFIFSEKMMTEDEFKKTLYEGEKKEGEIVDVAQEEDDTEDLSKVGLKDLEKGCSLKEESLCVELAKRCNSGNKDACNKFVSIKALLCENKDAGSCARLSEIYDYNLKVDGKVVFKKNHNKAVDYAKKACDLSENYCSTFGTRYLTGALGFRQDAKAGEFLLNKSCSSGSFYSCYLLGEAYTTGDVLVKNQSLAFKYQLKVCEIGKTWSDCSIGFKYEDGEGVPKNYSYAFKFFDILCENNEKEFCNLCGIYYLDGKGVIKDLKLSFLYTEKACILGSSDGCANLAIKYQQGSGVKKNVYTAVEYYKKACDLEQPNACFNLAIMYQNGDNVPKSVKLRDQFFYKASAYNKKLCDSGVKSACDEYAKLYDMGFGVEDVN